jgi:rRNA-processing protein FCF1
MNVENYTPSQVIQELRRIQMEAMKGSQALYEAEVAFAEADNKAEMTYQKAFISAVGSVELRKAEASLASSDDRLQADLRKAEVSRIKQKLKQLELAQMSTQTIARQTELEYKFA